MRSDDNRQRQCRDIERLLVFYVCDELSDAGRAAVDEHVKTCSDCAAALARERRLVAALPAREVQEPPPALLARCRSDLAESLDRLEEPGVWKSIVAAFRPASWFVAHPVWSAAMLLLLGVTLGQMVPRWLLQPEAPLPVNPSAVVSALGNQDLQSMGISGINWVPGSGSEAPNVEVQMTAARPVVVQGTLDNPDVKRVLLFIVQNNQRFDSGVRLDSVEVLRARSDDEDVRHALCSAARKDRNPSVRLRALEALRGSFQDPQVLQALLDALLHDDNPGVRIEAVNALRAMVEEGAAPSDERIRNVLRDRMQRDPNNYIRLQSAAAIRELGPRQVY